MHRIHLASVHLKRFDRRTEVNLTLEKLIRLNMLHPKIILLLRVNVHTVVYHMRYPWIVQGLHVSHVSRPAIVSLLVVYHHLLILQ